MGGKAIAEDFKPVRLQHVDQRGDRRPFNDMGIPGINVSPDVKVPGELRPQYQPVETVHKFPMKKSVLSCTGATKSSINNSSIRVPNLRESVIDQMARLRLKLNEYIEENT